MHEFAGDANIQSTAEGSISVVGGGHWEIASRTNSGAQPGFSFADTHKHLFWGLWQGWNAGRLVLRIGQGSVQGINSWKTVLALKGGENRNFIRTEQAKWVGHGPLGVLLLSVKSWDNGDECLCEDSSQNVCVGSHTVPI